MFYKKSQDHTRIAITDAKVRIDTQFEFRKVSKEKLHRKILNIVFEKICLSINIPPRISKASSDPGNMAPQKYVVFHFHEKVIFQRLMSS